jgi:signal transduction histidine kinase
VAKIVEEHHGSIRVESEPGGGACFVIFFPVEPAVVPKETALLSG